MALKTDQLLKLTTESKIDPMEFDVTMIAFLIGLGAEKYIDIFRKNKIGQCTLVELSDEDLIKLGVEEPTLRNKILEEVKNLPVFSESELINNVLPSIGPLEIGNILDESYQHMHRIYLSMLANTLTVKKTKKIQDCLLYENKYASDIGIETLNEIAKKLNTIEITLNTQLKDLLIDESSHNKRKKKVIVGVLGTAAIAILTAFFVKSLKELN